MSSKKRQFKIIANKKKKGFSIAEVLLSLVILEMGLTATMGLMIASVNSARESRNRIIASQLAQEGVEIVRNIRDDSLINPTEQSFQNIAEMVDFCAVDMLETEDIGLINCSTATIKRLYWDGNFFRSHEAVSGVGEPTNFFRQVSVRNSDPAVDRIVTVMVIWRGDEFPWFPNIDECTWSNKCSYVQTTLTTWGD